MNLPELRDLITLIGTVLVLSLALIIPIYLIANRKPKRQALRIFWALFWRGPILVLFGATLYPEMAILSAILSLIVIVGPLELRAWFLGSGSHRLES